ncbi:MAG: hypothetical protein HPY90_10170 [Syntrophothermus sp.]|uniref:hypothetical protein n=1 Tax=Syntrophothermus sp. TaxID=2736299 RepID=UPI00257CC509|nr:hypothetical protein [Syntrophothermus sp.]NSW83617.1 hypothetical protein [Syntrophothermus sp.]
MSKKIFIAVGVLLLTIAGLAGVLYGEAVVAAGSPKETAKNFAVALAEGDVDRAASLAVGEVAFKVSQAKGNLPAAKVDSIGCRTRAIGRGWAKVDVQMELTLADGSVDVGWYTTELVNEDGWKVAAFRESQPELSGMTFFTGSPDGVKKAFEGYAKALSEGDYTGAGKYLVGPARRLHEQSAPVLGKGKVLGTVEDVQAETIYQQGKVRVVRVKSLVDRREVELLVVGVQVKSGWKIAYVLQV